MFVYDQALKTAFFDMTDEERPPFYFARRLTEAESMLPASRRLKSSVDKLRESCVEASYNDGDNGFSWGNILRFKPIQISDGGRYRLCFCDYTLTADGECKTAADYDLDLGYVHASGVSCFLDQDRFKRDRHCVSQYHGGQRCYDDPLDEPDVGEPEYQAVVPAWDDADLVT